ncbi:MAG: signal peptidase II [Oscillospiraceae bacterium]|nr:signal peptidase II [Oscillospiraceae bacterium]
MLNLKSRKAAFIAIIISALLVGIDILTKWLVVKHIDLGSSVRGLRIGSLELVNFTYIRNYGAAFGVLRGMTSFLILFVSLFLIGTIVVLFSGRIKSKWTIAALALIIGGGTGNLVDRIRLGYVIDFIELRFIQFAIFNFADMCAVVGASMLFIMVVGDEIREYRVKKACEFADEALPSNRKEEQEEKTSEESHENPEEKGFNSEY